MLVSLLLLAEDSSPSALPASMSRRLVCLLITLLFRPCRLRFNSLPYPIAWNRLGCSGDFHNHAEYTELRPRGGLE